MDDVFTTKKLSISLQKQLNFPKGKEGATIGRQLYRGNARPINEAIQEIDFRPGLKIVDIGCGPGYSLEKMSAKLKQGEIIGADPSKQMRVMARKINSKSIASGLVNIVNQATPNLAFASNYFDYALLNNVIYFMPRDGIKQHLRSVLRIVKNGGKLILYMTSQTCLKESIDEKDGVFTMYSVREVKKILRDIKFHTISSRKIDIGNGEYGYTVTAIK